MATNFIREQVAPAATTPTTLYTVPVSKETVVSTILVCNRGGSAATFRIALRKLGAVLANEHYLYFDVAIGKNDTFAATLGVTLIATDIVEVYASNSNCTFQLYGQENN